MVKKHTPPIANVAAAMPDSVGPRWRDVLILMVLGFLLIVPGLGIGGLPGLPVIDRDEARYAQASVQMIESGDYVNIRFQDRARHKKPAGAYWAQVLSLKLFGVDTFTVDTFTVDTFTVDSGRQIWVHRIPSALAGLLTILALYWGSCAVLGRKIALAAAVFLAISAGFIFEAHIAKTDALICYCSCLCLLALMQLRHRAFLPAPLSTDKPSITKPSLLDPAGPLFCCLLFWGSIGASIMIKGPILPVLIGLCLFSLAVWDKVSPQFSGSSARHWLRPLLNPLGILLCLMIILPWSILIWQETNGAFFTDAIMGDLTPKLKGGQESHGAPMGYYLLSIWIAFWPSSLLLVPAIAYGLKRSIPRSVPSPIPRSVRSQEPDVEHRPLPLSLMGKDHSSLMRLCLCWILPFYIMLELTPTKLPHYPLPLYPALAILCAYALYAVQDGVLKRGWWRYGSYLFLLFSAVLLTALGGALVQFQGLSIWPFLIFGAAALIAMVAVFSTKANIAPHYRLKVLVGLALLTNVYTYQFALPSLQSMHIAARVQNVFEKHNFNPREHRILSLHYFEPSLIYHLGTHVEVGKAKQRLESYIPAADDFVIVDRERDTHDEFMAILNNQTNKAALCIRPVDRVKGFNYAKGDPVDLSILHIHTCVP